MGLCGGRSVVRLRTLKECTPERSKQFKKHIYKVLAAPQWKGTRKLCLTAYKAHQMRRQLQHGGQRGCLLSGWAPASWLRCCPQCPPCTLKGSALITFNVIRAKLQFNIPSVCAALCPHIQDYTFSILLLRFNQAGSCCFHCFFIVSAMHEFATQQSTKQCRPYASKGRLLLLGRRPAFVYWIIHLIQRKQVQQA